MKEDPKFKPIWVIWRCIGSHKGYPQRHRSIKRIRLHLSWKLYICLEPFRDIARKSKFFPPHVHWLSPWYVMTPTRFCEQYEVLLLIGWIGDNLLYLIMAALWNRSGHYIFHSCEVRRN